MTSSEDSDPLGMVMLPDDPADGDPDLAPAANADWALQDLLDRYRHQAPDPDSQRALMDTLIRDLLSLSDGHAAAQPYTPEPRHRRDGAFLPQPTSATLSDPLLWFDPSILMTSLAALRLRFGDQDRQARLRAILVRLAQPSDLPETIQRAAAYAIGKLDNA